jgi:hypothetical protein
MKIAHLAKRALSSLLQTPPSPQDVAIVSDVLNTAEFAAWSEMQHRDQRHSIIVLNRFVALVPGAVTAERAAALLHDVGKNISRLGFFLRVIATVVGPKGKRFTEYHNHESLGAELMRSVSDARTVALIGGTANDDVSRHLQAADDV